MPRARLSQALRALSAPPQHTWPDTVVHHGFRVLLLLGLVVLMQLLFPVTPVLDFPELELGDVPQQDVIAESAFPIPKSETELTQERDDAAASVPPIVRFDPAAADTMLARLRLFIAHVDSAARHGENAAERRESLLHMLMAYGFPVSFQTLDMLLAPPNRLALLRSLERTVQQVMPLGVVSSGDYEDSPEPQWRILRDNTEQLIPRDSVRTQSWLYGRAEAHLPAVSPEGLAEFQRWVLIRFFEGSYKLDRQRTQQAREQARQAVLTVKNEVVRGERVVAAHEPIREREMERLAAYRQHLLVSGAIGDGAGPRGPIIGMFLLNLLILSIFGLLLLLNRNHVYRDVRHVLLIAMLIALTAVAAAAVGRTAAPVQLVPIAFPALVVAVLWDGRMALNFALVLAALLSIQTPFQGLSARVLLLLGGGAAALSVRVVQRRSQGLMLGVVVAVAYALATLALGLIRGHEAADILRAIGWGAASGMASALIAMGFLPLFEAFTRITTDQTLLELADLNRPLLKRLSLEASGTYAHSINVANIAEAAARAIGANSLLVRVGAYYHDVGKIASPHYFIENQARGRNPHDQIDPRKSVQIIRTHVSEGMKLAEQAKLPESVLKFIPEHHGTQSIGFFLDKAREANPDAEIDPADFAYTGPRPRSRETAILMLADSIESATKVLQDPTPERVRTLVDRVVDAKIAEGQLDDTPLTFRDLARIKEQFTTVLSGMYHHRIDYPSLKLPDSEARPAPESGAADR